LGVIMLIERQLGALVVRADEPISVALRQISLNRHRTVFCVDDDGVLVGVITDGDFRRWILDHPASSLEDPSGVIANRSFVSAPYGAPFADIERLFSDAVLVVPLVDDRMRLVAIARPRTKGFSLAGRLVDVDEPALVVAEIGINHNGSVDVAQQLVDAAVDAEADCVKFQMRDLGSLYRNEGMAADFREDLGAQYTMDLLQRFSLPPEAILRLMDYAASRGLVPLCTPWDLVSAEALEHYGIPGFKVASADVTNHELLAYLSSTNRPVIMSTGMSTEDEIIESVDLLARGASPYALLHCNSTYPAPYRDVHLRYMDRLTEVGNCLVGYSGHERGHHVAVAAVALGARIVEKHITLDRSWQGNDHKVSLLPGELRTMIREIRELEESLGGLAPRAPSQGELMNRVNLAKSLVASRSIPAGTVVGDDMLSVRSPGRGLQPNLRAKLVGRRLRREVEAGDFFFPSDLEDGDHGPRSFKFHRPWGLPVRYHDYRELLASSNPDFLEFHLSYRDMDLAPLEMVPEPVSTGLIVHSPDHFFGDHLMDLASGDEAERRHSLGQLQRVIEITRELATRFVCPVSPLVVSSLGGFSQPRPIAPRDIPELYGRVAAALEELDTSGVELIAQTLPPFPWFFGGQHHGNLFCHPQDTASFAAETGMRLCLDVAHTKLACNHLRIPLSEAMELLMPHTAHFHVVDAAGLDGEGLQIEEGEVDFRMLADQMDRFAPRASFIPEIWQGHKNSGEGFWIALDRLERYL
jgi:sialic acid synthase SpsE/sugar phosphate isomerase/epimerase